MILCESEEYLYIPKKLTIVILETDKGLDKNRVYNWVL